VNWTISTGFFLAVGLMICSGSVLAHRSNSMYNRDQQTELKGEVTDFQWQKQVNGVPVSWKDGRSTDFAPSLAYKLSSGGITSGTLRLNLPFDGRILKGRPWDTKVTLF
jgi:hypothetical protein